MLMFLVITLASSTLRMPVADYDTCKYLADKVQYNSQQEKPAFKCITIDQNDKIINEIIIPSSVQKNDSNKKIHKNETYI